MKLKKVVSLALAGVMAVSMLAGCGTSGKKEPTEDENGTTQVGYSTEFGKIVDLQDMDYITFKDSTVDQAALKKAVASCTDAQLLAALVAGNLDVAGPGYLQGVMVVPSEIDGSTLPCVKVFTKEADLDDNGYVGTSFATTDILAPSKLGVLFVADGTASIETTLTQISDLMKDEWATLAKDNNPDKGEAGVNYSYTVSVSVVGRATTTTNNLVTADMNFVAVTITRTGTLANEA